MIERRQPPPGFESLLYSISSARAASEALAESTSDALQPTDTSLDLPSATLPASTNSGDAPSTTVVGQSATTTDPSSSSATAALTAHSTDGSGLSEDAKIGLGVGLGVGLSLLLALLAILCLMRRRKRSQAQMGKYTPQVQSDVSMVEGPGAMAAAQNRQIQDEPYEPPKHFDDYSAYEAPRWHPAYDAPISTAEPSELQIPPQRNFGDLPPVLTIPEPEHSTSNSVVPSPARGESPVSPMSMSPVSPIGSRPPSPKHNR